MERPLLERQQLRFGRITPCTLRKDEDTLPKLLHFSHRTIERLHSRLTIRAINKHGAGQGHEPAQKRPALERLLRRNGTIRREDSTQHQHIKLSLMIPDENRWPRGKILLALDDIEMHTRGNPHDPFETPCRGPLRYSSVANQPQHYGCDNAVGSAYNQRGVRGETARDEAGFGHFDGGEREEGDGYSEVAG